MSSPIQISTSASHSQSHGPLRPPMPPMPPISPDELAVLATLIDRHALEPGALLPLLHAVQDAFGRVPADAVPIVAKGLNLSRAEVHGVVTYYHFFRSAPPGRTVVQVCRAESCKSVGADALFAHAERLLGCPSHGTRADGAVTLEPVYCFGLCALSPNIMVDGRPYSRMTVDKLDRLAERLGLVTGPSLPA